MAEPESVVRLQDLLARLEQAVADLEASEDPEATVEKLGAMSELAREVQAEIERARREAADASA